ncbi:MAG: histidinol dehydrogenase [Pseudomonadota bacterium]
MSAALVRRLDSAAPGFTEALDALLEWDTSESSDLRGKVEAIIADVRRDGDAALVDCTRRFDRWAPADSGALEISRAELDTALERLPESDRLALTGAAARIRAYHEHQVEESWGYVDEAGNRLGQRVTALERVGLYVPGGQAAYPSTVLMTAIPAKVAGVDEIVMVVPTPDGTRNRFVLAAAAVAGVDRVFAVGGAQAIAALAFGTTVVPRVDKIVGPGGAFVAEAKRQVFGPVAIDMIAGPSEILIIADDAADPDLLALDLFSQAEHDAAAQAILLTPSADLVERTAAALERLLTEMSRADVIRASLSGRGALIRTRDLDDAVAIANRVAPEHLSIQVAPEQEQRVLDGVRHAGAVFVGAASAEVMGDYAAGPSHVLPTFGTARYASPLGVYDFRKRTSVIQLSSDGVEGVARIAAQLADGEGLTAHAAAARARLAGFDHNG